MAMRKTEEYQLLVDPRTLGIDGALAIYLANRIDRAVNIGIDIGRKLNG